MNKKFLAILLATTVLSAGVVRAEPKVEPAMDKAEVVKVEKSDKADKVRRLGKKHHQEMAERMAQDLGLTAEQRQKSEEIRKESQKKIKPLMDEMKALREKIDAERKANMEEFEKILTPEQKEKFEAIKKRGAEDFKRRHKEMREFMKGRHHKKVDDDRLLPHERGYEKLRGQDTEHEEELRVRGERMKGHRGERRGEMLPPPPSPADDEAPMPPMPLLEDESILPPAPAE